MNDWNKIRAHYAENLPEIMAEETNEWGISPYAWDEAGITMTPIERWLWNDIRAVNLVLYPQFPVGSVFIDFANPRAKVAIECDGQEFHRDKTKDAARDAKLVADGWIVYRISGKDCRDGVDSDEPSKSTARRFINLVASFHNIKRGTGPC